MKYDGLNIGLMKQQNKGKLLSYIFTHGAVSQKELAKETGLTRSAVSQLLKNEIGEGCLLKEVGKQSFTAVGRKEVLLDINPDYRYLLSININRKDTNIVLCNLLGEKIIEKKIKTTLKIKPEQFLKKISKASKAIMMGYENKILGASVGIVGLVDREKGISLNAYGLWNKEVFIADILEKELGITVIVENNVKAFALAELLFAQGKAYDNLMVLKWGPGLGSTLIINHRIYEGNQVSSGEIGHMIVDLKNGDGKVTLEEKVSYDALRYKQEFEIEKFTEAYQNSPSSFQQAIRLLAISILNCSFVLSLDVIIVYGSFFASKLVRDAVMKEIKRLDPSFDINRFKYSSLSEKEDYIGPVASFLYAWLFEMNSSIVL